MILITIIKFVLSFSGGLVFGTYGLRKYLLFKRIEKEGIITTGMIIDHEKEVDHDPDVTSIYYKPIIRFRNEKGEEITTKNELRSFRKLNSKKVEINYMNSDNHYVLIINEPFWKMHIPLFYFFLGLLLVICSILVLL